MRSIAQRQIYGQSGAIEGRGMTDEAAFLTRLTEAAEQLRIDIEAALKNSRNLLNIADTAHPKTLKECRKHRMLTDGQLFTIDQAAFRLKANVLSERIGNLHDRLDQFLERSNPDHPGPTRRRRSEQGIQDKYLSELSRWLYRDLARLASDPKYLGERYPYDQVPSVFQFWDYARASRHHSYITSEGYNQWRVWRDAGAKAASTQTLLDASKKFAALRLPYWIPECPELHPIIAHELAHQVLRDIYGYELHLGDLEGSGGGVNRMLRRLYRCIEEWTAEVDQSKGGAYRPLPIEILCDAMAASRCGVAYLYALYIEFLDNDVLADLAKDHTGMLEPISAELTSPNERRDRSRSLFIQAETLIDRQVTWLLRIVSVLGFVRKVFRPEGVELSFCDELDAHLKEVLALYASGDTATPDEDPETTSYYNHFTSFSKDIVHSLTTAGIVGASTPLMAATTKLWGTNNGRMQDFFLGRQMLGKAWGDVFARQFPDKRSPFNNENLLTALDLPWMGIWCHLADKPENTYTRLSNDLLNAIDAAREDYVFRTANPRAMFRLLGFHYQAKSGNPLIGSSSLDERLYQTAHSDWESAMVALELHEPGPRPFTFEGLIVLIKDPETEDSSREHQLHLPFVQAFSESKDVRRWFSTKARFRLDLLSIATNNKKECYKYRDGLVVHPCISGLQIASQVLLGRYDAFALVPRREQDSSDQAMYQCHKEAKYTSRSRNLIYASNANADQDLEVGGEVTQRAQEAIAIVLVGLHWPGLRLLFLHWIQRNHRLYPRLLIDMFVSDGWEDFTLIVRAVDVDSGSSNELIREFANFVETLNAHPFVTVTETLFTARFLDIEATGAIVDVTFNCRINPLGSGFPSAKGLKLDVDTRLASNGGTSLDVQVSSVYGLTDYRVTVQGWRNLKDVGDVLDCLYDVESILRLDTRVSIRAQET